MRTLQEIQREHHVTTTVALAIQRIEAERDMARRTIRELLPFVLEDYYPDFATPEYRAAVEAAKDEAKR